MPGTKELYRNAGVFTERNGIVEETIAFDKNASKTRTVQSGAVEEQIAFDSNTKPRVKSRTGRAFHSQNRNNAKFSLSVLGTYFAVALSVFILWRLILYNECLDIARLRKHLPGRQILATFPHLRRLSEDENISAVSLESAHCTLPAVEDSGGAFITEGLVPLKLPTLLKRSPKLFLLNALMFILPVAAVLFFFTFFIHNLADHLSSQQALIEETMMWLSLCFTIFFSAATAWIWVRRHKEFRKLKEILVREGAVYSKV